MTLFREIQNNTLKIKIQIYIHQLSNGYYCYWLINVYDIFMI